MNRFNNISPFRNKYFIMRHGESEANLAGLITSDPVDCIPNYGLTEHGNNVVTVAIRKAKQRGWLDVETLIYCSDFKRTVETAKLAQQILHAGNIHLSQALRERSFGAFNGQHAKAYIEIWAEDEQERLVQQKNGVESVEDILHRLMEFMKSLEVQYTNKRLLLVSHGDPLQVLQAGVKGLKPSQSRVLKYIEPGEIRELS